MIRRDLKNNLKLAQSLAPAARTASANGAEVDTQGFGSVLFVADIGLFTDGEFLYSAEHRDEGEAFGAIPADELEGAFTTIDDATEDNTTQKVGYKGTKQFVRMVLTENAGSPASATGVVSTGLVVMGNAGIAPVA